MITAFATASPLTAFLGPIGGPEMIMLIFILVPTLIIIAMVKYFRPKNQSPPHFHRSTASRLAEINHLRAQNLITAEEHEAKRKQILEQL